jgi:SAM-dependent methyltransferase
MPEVDLMRRYPKSRRKDLLELREEVTEEERAIARQFGWEYFDGPRRLGMGGYRYDPRFFKPVVEDMIEHYKLEDDCSILDVGCGKGFMVKDFREALPDATVVGIDISEYCLTHAVVDDLYLGSCDDLPFGNNEFDLVVSIATIHNVDLVGTRKSLMEISRVGRGHSYIKVNGYRTEKERAALERWNLVAETILHVDQWLELFAKVGYVGDYSFFTP